MNNKALKDYLHENITKNLEATLGILVNALKSNPETGDLHQSAILLSARYNDVQQQITNGTISTENANMEKMRIRQGVLNLTNQLETLPELNSPLPDSAQAAPPPPQQAPKDYNTRQVRQLLLAAFSDEDFNDFCMDEFFEVYNNFSGGQSRKQRVNKLLDHAKRYNKMQEILQKVEQINPVKYKEFEPYYALSKL